MFQSYNGSIATMLFCGGHPHVPLTMGALLLGPQFCPPLRLRASQRFGSYTCGELTFSWTPGQEFSPSLAEKETRGVRSERHIPYLKGRWKRPFIC